MFEHSGARTENEVPTLNSLPTLTGLLATIEAIPETPENYRPLRAAIRDTKTLIAEAAK